MWIGAARVAHSCPRLVCRAQSSRGVWGHAPPGKLKFRLCESAFEAVGDHYNRAKFVANGV